MVIRETVIKKPIFTNRLFTESRNETKFYVDSNKNLSIISDVITRLIFRLETASSEVRNFSFVFFCGEERAFNERKMPRLAFVFS